MRANVTINTTRITRFGFTIFPMGIEEYDLELSNIRSFQYPQVANNPSVTAGVPLSFPKLPKISPT